MRRGLLYVIGALAALLLLAVALLDSGWARDRALHFALQRAAEDAGFAAASGSLLRGVRVEGIHLRRVDGLTMDLDVLEAEASWWRLLDDTFVLRHLRLLGLRLRLPEADAARPQDSPPFAFSTPLPLRIERLLLADVELQGAQLANGMPKRLERLDAALGLTGSELEIEHLRLQADDADLQLQAGLDLEPPYAWTLTATLAGQAPIALPWAGPVDLSIEGRGRSDAIDLALDVRAPLPASLEIRYDGASQPLQARLDLEQLPLAPWVNGLQAQAVRLTVDGPLQALAWRLDGELIWPSAPAGYQRASSRASGSLDDLERLQIDLLRLDMPAGALSGQGSLIRGDPLRVELAVDSGGLDLAPWRSGLRLSRLDLQARGALDALTLGGDLMLDWPLADQPGAAARTAAVAAHLDARLDDLARLDIATLALRQGERSLDMTGSLDVQDSRAFDVHWQGTPPELARLLGLGHSRLTLSGAARGTLRPLDARLADLRLGGTWNAAPVDGTAGARLVDGQLRDLQADVRIGAGRLGARGRLTPTELDMHLEADLPDLALLWPDASGALQADVQLGGRPDAWSLAGALQVDTLSWGDLRLATAELSLQPGTPDTGPVGRVEGSAGGLAWGEQLDSGRLTLAGHWPDVRLQAAGRTPAGHLETALTIDINDYGTGRYGLIVESIELREMGFGDWILRQPVSGELETGPFRLRLADGCLDSAPADLCWRPLRLGPDPDLRVELRGADLDRLGWLLRDDLELAAPLEADLHYDASGAVADVRVAAGSLRFTDGREVLFEDAIDGLTAHVSWRAETVEGEARARFAQAGQFGLDATAQLDETGALARLRADLDSNLDDLGFVAALVPGLTDTTGSLRGDVQLEGTPDQLEARGALSLAFGGDIPAANLKVTAGALSLRAEGGRALQLDGGVALNDTPAQLQGTLSWEDLQAPAMDVRLTGEAVPLAAAAEVSVRVSPDLRLHGPLRALQLDGSIDIPEARVRLTGLPQQGPKLSDDVIIHGAEGVNGSGNGAQPLGIDLRVSLGSAVRFVAGPLDTRVEGALRLLRSGRQSLSASGRLQTADGTIKAFGEALEIRQGQLFFDGVPDNPALNVLALRQVANQEVGIRATGYLRDIDTEIYSAPPLDDAAALTMLITGEPIANASAEQIASVRERALSAGIAGASPALTALVRNVGLDELTLQQPASEDSGALVVGKRIDERIYARYRYGLRTQSFALLVEYQLSDRVVVQSETGSVHGIDILFRREYE